MRSALAIDTMICSDHFNMIFFFIRYLLSLRFHLIVMSRFVIVFTAITVAGVWTTTRSIVSEGFYLGRGNLLNSLVGPSELDHLVQFIAGIFARSLSQ